MRAKEEGFYHSKAWRKLRKLALQRDHFLCQHCLREGKTRRATEVHHIVEVEVNPDLALCLDNLTSLCWNCHELTKKRGQKKLPAEVRIIKVIDGGKDKDLPPYLKSERWG